jgi:hypothetical protein
MCEDPGEGPVDVEALRPELVASHRSERACHPHVPFARAACVAHRQAALGRALRVRAARALARDLGARRAGATRSCCVRTEKVAKVRHVRCAQTNTERCRACSALTAAANACNVSVHDGTCDDVDREFIRSCDVSTLSTAERLRLSGLRTLTVWAKHVDVKQGNAYAVKAHSELSAAATRSPPTASTTPSARRWRPSARSAHRRRARRDASGRRRPLLQ